MTLTKIQIENLKKEVELAKTQTSEGRQTVANACKSLYNLIEKDIYEAGKEWMLKGMYKDLCSGNFAEPFYCELKKDTFFTVCKIYEQI